MFVLRKTSLQKKPFTVVIGIGTRGERKVNFSRDIKNFLTHECISIILNLINMGESKVIIINTFTHLL